MPDPLNVAQGAASGASSGSTLGAWGALAGGVLGAAASWWLGDQAAAARKAASLEQVRRQDRQNAFTLGDATSRAAASGVELTGTDSMSKYLADMGNEFRRQHDWSVQQANRGADLSKISDAIGGLTGIGGSMFRFGQANNWWGLGGPAIRPSNLLFR